MLSVEHVTKKYGQFTALEDISLTFTTGVYGLLAPNGAGKTTLARCLCGLMKEQAGTILWGGSLLGRKERRRRAFLIMQDVNLQLFGDSVLAEARLGSTATEQEALAALEQMDLVQYAQAHPLALSGGQKQRLAIVDGCLSGKELLIFDEPTSGLDFDSMAQVAGLIRRLSDMGKVIFIVTHDFEFVCRTCSRVLHFDEGEMPDDVPVIMEALPKLRELFSVSDGKER